MPVVIKNSNFAFLKKVGISADKIDALKEKGIKLCLGYKDLAFVSKNNESLVDAIMLPVSSNELMKGIASAEDVLKSLSILENGISVALGEIVSPSLLEKEKVTGEKAVPAKMPKSVKVNPASVLTSGAVPSSGDPIALRDAEWLYQRVQGTSSGSVYIVVAITDDGVKIACRVHGTNLSVRAEGHLTEGVKNRLASQGVELKKNTSTGEYASGHFECGAKVPCERVLGAVLLGFGLIFKTPLPNMDTVRKLCS